MDPDWTSGPAPQSHCRLSAAPASLRILPPPRREETPASLQGQRESCEKVPHPLPSTVALSRHTAWATDHHDPLAGPEKLYPRCAVLSGCVESSDGPQCSEMTESDRLGVLGRATSLGGLNRRLRSADIARTGRVNRDVPTSRTNDAGGQFDPSIVGDSESPNNRVNSRSSTGLHLKVIPGHRSGALKDFEHHVSR